MNLRVISIFTMLLILLGSLVSVIQDHRSPITAPPVAILPAGAIPVASAILRVKAPISTSASSAFRSFVVSDAVQVPHPMSIPMVFVDASGGLKYVAREGDTIAQLAIALLGNDSKEHRNAVVAANESLKPGPDRVFVGQTYSITLAAIRAADEADAGPQPDPAPTASTPAK